jgi:hypothetical protein
MQDLALEPVTVRQRGRPAGALNNPLPEPSEDASTCRDPSSFERVLSQEENRGQRGRGRGRTQPNNEDTASVNRGGNRGRPRGSGGQGRDGTWRLGVVVQGPVL